VRRLAIHRRGVEGTHERLSVARADRRTIEPVHAMHRRPDRRQWPLLHRAVGDGKVRDVAGRIIPCDNTIARRVPMLAPRRIRTRSGRCGVRRPGHRVHRQRLELETIPLRAVPAAGHVKRDGRASGEGRDGEAVVIELLLREGSRRAPLVGTEREGDTRHRVAHDLELVTSGGDHTIAVRGAEQVADAARLAGAKIHDASPRRAPRVPAARVDVEVVLIRQKRTEHVQNIELGGRLLARIGFAVFIGREGFLVRMRARIRRGHSRHDRVRENERTVAGEEIAAIQELADEQRVVVGFVVVGAVDLVPSAAVARHHERLAADLRASLHGRNPIRRVAADDEKLCARRRIARRAVRAACRSASGDREERRTQRVANDSAGESEHPTGEYTGRPGTIAGQSIKNADHADLNGNAVG